MKELYDEIKRLPLINNPKIKEALEKRCKHNMILEYCGICQRVDYKKEIKFPIAFIDSHTGKPKTIFLRKEVDRYYLKRYR